MVSIEELLLEEGYVLGPARTIPRCRCASCRRRAAIVTSEHIFGNARILRGQWCLAELAALVRKQGWPRRKRQHVTRALRAVLVTYKISKAPAFESHATAVTRLGELYEQMPFFERVAS